MTKADAALELARLCDELAAWRTSGSGRGSIPERFGRLTPASRLDIKPVRRSETAASEFVAEGESYEIRHSSPTPLGGSLGS